MLANKISGDKLDLLSKLNIDRNRDGVVVNQPGMFSRRGIQWLIGGITSIFLVVFGAVLSAGKTNSVESTPNVSLADDVAVGKTSQVVESKQTLLIQPEYVLNGSGYVVARRMATVSSKFTGKVTEILVEEGMAVEAGQLLGRMEADTAQTEFNLAQSRLAAAGAAVHEAEARLREAETTLERIKNLESRQLISYAELDAARAAVDTLQAAKDTRLAEQDITRQQLELSRQNLDDTYIRAPFAGMVTVKNAQPGEIVSPVSAGGGFTRTGICTVVDMTSLEIEVDVNELYINRVVSGQLVHAQLDAYPELTIPARVAAVVPTADRQRATIKVRIKFDQLDPRILPEMGVKVSFLEKEQS